MHLVRIVGLGAAYVAGGRLGLWLAFEHGSVSPAWPPTGIAMAALLVWGVRTWPGVALGAFVVNALTEAPLAAVAGITVGNTLEAVVGVLLLQRLGVRGEIGTLRDVLALLTGALVAPVASATVGVASLCVSGAADWPGFGRLWWQWWLGDGMGALVIVPLVLSWRGAPRFLPTAARAVEVALLGVGLGGVSVFVFGRPLDPGFLDQSYWVFPLLVWAALRFGLRGVSLAALVASGLAIWGTVRGLGPFTTASTAASLVLLQAFLGVLGVTGLILAAVTTERHRAEAALAQANDELERRVDARTADLARTNGELAQQNQENEAFVFAVSHDLRSPLVNLEGFSHELELTTRDLGGVLAQASLPEDVRVRARRLEEDMADSIRFIRTGVVRLTTHTDALLKLARAGRVDYDLRCVELQPLVTRIVASLRATVGERRATVEIEDVSPVWGDAAALEQIFANLIGNALQFLDPARPGVVTIGQLGLDEDGGRRTYFVRDNGLGIAEAQIPKVFDAFRRFHTASAPGAGLGLAIVRRAVERHGGRVWVSSQVGAGSTFFVALPAAPETRPPRPHRADTTNQEGRELGLEG